MTRRGGRGPLGEEQLSFCRPTPFRRPALCIIWAPPSTFCPMSFSSSQLLEDSFSCFSGFLVCLQPLKFNQQILLCYMKVECFQNISICKALFKSALLSSSAILGSYGSENVSCNHHLQQSQTFVTDSKCVIAKWVCHQHQPSIWRPKIVCSQQIWTKYPIQYFEIFPHLRRLLSGVIC